MAAHQATAAETPALGGLEAEADDWEGDSAIGGEEASSTASMSSSILRYRQENGRTYHAYKVTLPAPHSVNTRLTRTGWEVQFPERRAGERPARPPTPPLQPDPGRQAIYCSHPKGQATPPRPRRRHRHRNLGYRFRRRTSQHPSTRHRSQPHSALLRPDKPRVRDR